MVTDCINDRIKTVDYLLDEIELRIKDAGVEMLQLMLSPPGIGNEYEKWFVDIVRRRG